MITFVFEEGAFAERFQDIYDLVHNNPIFDQVGLKKHQVKCTSRDKNYDELAEYCVDMLKLNHSNFLNRNIFYQTYWNSSDIDHDEFIKNTSKYSSGYHIRNDFNHRSMFLTKQESICGLLTINSSSISSTLYNELHQVSF